MVGVVAKLVWAAAVVVKNFPFVQNVLCPLHHQKHPPFHPIRGGHATKAERLLAPFGVGGKEDLHHLSLQTFVEWS